MKALLLFGAAALLSSPLYAQCNTFNATSCVCADGTSTTCDLLPDITISWYALANYLGGPSEYSQSGNGANDGRLRVTGSTPNIGFGAFTVRGTNYFVCGRDTFPFNPGPCADGSLPKQLLHQRIYRKNGSQMTYTDRFAGAMTYHPTHGHNHVDDWAAFTLRIPNPNEPDPRRWEVVGEGAKIGFCLMDYGSCSAYSLHCRDNNTVFNQGAVLNSPAQFPNYGMGGGGYSCSPIEQGISVGYTDIYSENLDGMWINIPPNTCNGNYYIVVEVDPRNNFLESDETNNYTAIPFTLTRQNAPGNAVATITSDRAPQMCQGESMVLKANAGSRYSWSTGDTTRTINVTAAGSYSVTVTNFCGTATSAPFQVQMRQAPAAPVVFNDTVCTGTNAHLLATGTGTLQWFDGAGQQLATGPLLTTPTLSSNADYFVRAVDVVTDTTFAPPRNNSFGQGSYLQSPQYLVFNAVVPFTLRSVKVYALSAGTRLIQLQNSSGVILASASVQVPVGESRVALNFNVPAGSDLRLVGAGTPNLFRSSTGISYPYMVPGVLSITNSSGGNGFYYYFYDWEVIAQRTACASPLVPVKAVVEAPSAVLAGLDSSYSVFAAPDTLAATPAGGVFSGPGMVGNVFDPALAGTGGPYTISYTYTSPKGCSVTTTQQTIVTGVLHAAAPAALTRQLHVYPNPASGAFRVAVPAPAAQPLLLVLTDLLGREVYRHAAGPAAGSFSHEVSVAGLSKGTYLLRVALGQESVVRKVVVQ